MKTVQQLKEERGQKLSALQAIVDKATTEQRDLNDDEKTQRDTLNSEIDALDVEIRAMEKTEKRMLEAAGTFVNNENAKQEKKEIRSYSFVKAIQAKVEGRELEGIEKEMHEEAVKEFRELGQKLEGIGVPSIALQPEEIEQRAQSVGTPSAGGYTVIDQPGSFIEALKSKLLVRSLGANVLSGLNGDVPFSKENSKPIANWSGEIDTATEKSLDFSQPKLVPHRLPAFTIMSKQLILQSSLDVQRLVQNDLIAAIQRAVDLAAINGSGASNEPTGILNTSGIGLVPGGTDGAAPSWDHIVSLETEVATDDADVGQLAYLTNPKVRGKLKKTKLDAGSGQFVWPMDGKLNGYNTGISTQVPSNLTKGTGTGLSAIIFGNFSDVLIGQWGGLDIVVNPYTYAREGQVEIVVNSFWDVLIRHAESFAAMVDAITA